MSLLLPLIVLLAAAAHQPGAALPGFEPRAASQARPCLTAPEAKALATFVLPGLVEGLGKRCERSLPANAYLRAPEARTLAQRLRRDAAPSWPAARLAIEKLNGSRLPGFLGTAS
jgi:hypothetical protein